MSEHTKEPWRTTNGIGGRPTVISSNEDDIAYTVIRGAAAKSMQAAEDNARRIVACVNHCKNVPNDYLESGSAEWYHEYVKRDRPALERRIDELIKQRDEALAVLEIYANMGGPGNRARSFINKIKPTP